MLRCTRCNTASYSSTEHQRTVANPSNRTSKQEWCSIFRRQRTSGYSSYCSDSPIHHGLFSRSTISTRRLLLSRLLSLIECVANRNNAQSGEALASKGFQRDPICRDRTKRRRTLLKIR